MNKFGQGNSDDLQKAIDEITNSAGGAGDATAELESQIQGQMGVPPVPPMSGAGVPEMKIPGVPTPEMAPATEPVTAEPAVAEPTVAAAPATESAVEPAPAMPEMATASVEMGGDLAKVRESALQELVPLMDKIDISAAEKFDIYSEVIESTHDKSTIEKAFEAARAIEDEKVKAESLLKLVKMIDSI